MMLKRSLIALIASLATVSTGDAQTLSRKERQLVDWVNAHTSEETAFLESIVNINSGTFNIAGVRAVGDVFDKEFRDLGFETRWVPVPAESRRAGHFYAEHKSRKNRKGTTVLLIGHLDTVFEGEGQKWEVLDDSTAKGAGSSDMKGGDAVILYALKAMKAAGTLDDANVIVALMGDEENGGEPDSVVRRSLMDAGRRSQVILGFEGDAGKSTVARRGASTWIVSATGRQAHSGGVFSRGSGYGAIYELARILDDFREQLSSEQYLTFNPGVIVGGTTATYDSSTLSGTAAGKTNIISPIAYAHGDLRFLTPEQLATARAKMTEIVSKHLPQTSASISFTDGIPSMLPTPGNYRLLAQLDSVTRALGQGPTEALDPGLRGAGDISYVSEFAPSLDGLGVDGRGAHTPDETVNLKSLPRSTARAAVLINRLVHQKNSRGPVISP